MFPPPPSPENPQYHGQKPGAWLRDFVAWVKGTRLKVSPDSGLRLIPTGDGIELRVDAGSIIGLAIVRTTASVGARLGTVPGGSGVNGKFQTYDGTNLSDGENVKLKNIWSQSASSNKYGIAIKLFGVWWLIVWDC